MVNKPSSWGIPWGIPHPLTPGCWPIPTTWPSPAPLWCFAEPARRGRWGASAWRTRKKRVRGIHRIAGTNIMTFMYLILYYVYIMYIIYMCVCNYIEYHFRERERLCVHTWWLYCLCVWLVPSTILKPPGHCQLGSASQLEPPNPDLCFKHLPLLVVFSFETASCNVCISLHGFGSRCVIPTTCFASVFLS